MSSQVWTHWQIPRWRMLNLGPLTVSVSWEDGEVVFGWVKPTIHLSGSTLPECGHAWLGVQGWRYSFGPVALLLALNTGQKLEVGFSIPFMFPFSLPCASSYLLLKTLNGVSRVHLRLLCWAYSFPDPFISHIFFVHSSVVGTQVGSRG